MELEDNWLDSVVISTNFSSFFKKVSFGKGNSAFWRHLSFNNVTKIFSFQDLEGKISNLYEVLREGDEANNALTTSVQWKFDDKFLPGLNFSGKTPLFFRYSGVNAANAVNLQAKRR